MIRLSRFFLRPNIVQRDALTPSRVRLVAPATSANMGPGFDLLGISLSVWNELEVSKASQFSISVTGEGSNGLIPDDETNWVVVGCKAVYDYVKLPMPPLAFELRNRIPFARGMGSSSAGIVAGLLAGATMAKAALTRHELLQLAAALEGHADNVAPCLFGGAQLGYHAENAWQSVNIPFTAGLQCCLFVPEHTVETKGSRKLPKAYPTDVVVHQMSRAMLVVAALAKNDLTLLRTAFDDKMHQPYRTGQNPHLYPVMAAAYDAGALGCYLSGSGPTVMALTFDPVNPIGAFQVRSKVHAIGDAMLTCSEQINCPGNVKFCTPSDLGAHITAVEYENGPPANRFTHYSLSTSGAIE